jgi:hypothetical protein
MIQMKWKEDPIVIQKVKIYLMMNLNSFKKMLKKILCFFNLYQMTLIN